MLHFDELNYLICILKLFKIIVMEKENEERKLKDHNS